VEADHLRPYEKAENHYNVPVEKLVPYENNPRDNEHSVKYVINTIKAVGFINPIIVDENWIILAGHTRLKAIKEMRWTECPHVKQVFGLSEEKKKLYRLADNSTNEAAAWNQTKLDHELKGIKELFKLTDFYLKVPDEADKADEKFDDTNCTFPLVPQFSEKYDALIVMFKNDIDFNNFKAKLNLEKVQSYKNSEQGEVRVVWFERLQQCLK